MSLAPYIGCNIELLIHDDDYSDNSFYIGRCFAGESELQNIKEYQLTTFYVYEVSSHWGIAIAENMNHETRVESKLKLLELCKRMEVFLKKEIILNCIAVGLEKKLISERVKLLSKSITLI